MESPTPDMPQIEYIDDAEFGYYYMHENEPPPSEEDYEEQFEDDSTSEEDDDTTPVVPVYLSSEEECLGNPLVLTKILKYCTTSELLYFRKVNKKWNTLATDIYVMRRDPHLTFGFSSGCDGYVLYGKHNRSLQMLNECLKNAIKFPCQRFSFLDEDLDKEDVQDFLNLHGQNVKYLVIGRKPVDSQEEDDAGATRIDILRKLLLIQAPNIEYLNISSFLGRWSTYSVPLFPMPVQLPKMKTLVVGSCSDDQKKIIGDIVRAAINLERYGDRLACFDIKDVDMLNSFKKIHTVKEAIIGPTADNVEYYERFANSNSKLIEIRFTLQSTYTQSTLWGPVGSAITKILESSKETLEIIDEFHPMAFLPDIKFPRLEKLRTLTLSKWVRLLNGIETVRMFPPEVRFAYNFPNLHNVNFDLHVGQQNQFWDNYFPFFDPAPSVRNLKIMRFCPAACLEKLAMKFPNVSTLSFKFPIEDFPTVGRAIWQYWTRVESIELEIDVGTWRNCYPFLDSAFTGLPRDTCTKVLARCQTEGVVPVEEVESLRAYTSILSLQNLKYLKITLSEAISSRRRSVFVEKSGEWEHPEQNGKPLISQITGLYAFDRLPELEVTIDAKIHTFPQGRRIRKALDSITPFVNPMPRYFSTLNTLN